MYLLLEKVNAFGKYSFFSSAINKIKSPKNEYISDCIVPVNNPFCHVNMYRIILKASVNELALKNIHAKLTSIKTPIILKKTIITLFEVLIVSKPILPIKTPIII